MWECNYGREPLDLRLLVLRLIRKSWMLILAAVLGVLLVGGPYFLRKVVFGPAKEYEAVTDFYIDYAVQPNGEQYTYINQYTWTQLVKDDVFTDKILAAMAGMSDASEISGTGEVSEINELSGTGEATGKNETSDGDGISPDASREVPLTEIEEAAGITKQQLQECLYATMLSDTRIVTTTVTTNVPELTMRINKALIQAMFAFGEEQKEIAGVRLLQEPTEASQVIADVRTFRACMLGLVIFVFVTALAMLVYYVLDEGIYVPATFERRYGIPMLGTINSPELPVLAGKLLADSLSGEKPSAEGQGGSTESRSELLEKKTSEEKPQERELLTEKPVLLSVYDKEDLEQVKTALQKRGVETAGMIQNNILFGERDSACHIGEEETEKSASARSTGEMSKENNAASCAEKELPGTEILLVVKAGIHNGKPIEKTLDFCQKCGLHVKAAILWDADEKLIRAYELPEHVLGAWFRSRK